MMKYRKGQMALEYIVKLVIVLVVVSVVIGMIYTFKGDILKKWKLVSDPGKEEPEPNAAYLELGGSFSAQEFANVIETCWAETRNARDSKVCFVVKGTPATGVDSATVGSLLDSSINVNFDGVTFGPTKELYAINYEIMKDMIYVKN